MYIELHCSSAFSFLDAASLPETLVARAAALGYPALALLDRDGVHGIPRFHKAARAAGVKAIVGAELSIQGPGTGDQGPDMNVPGPHQNRSQIPGPRSPAPGPRSPVPVSWRLPVLVETRQGYQNLCRLVTLMNLRAPKGEGALTLADFDGHTAGLIAIVGREALAARRHGLGGLVDRLVGLFGREQVCLELQRHFLRDEDAGHGMLRDLAAAFHVPLIVSNGVRFAEPADRPLFDVLTCIRYRTTLAAAGRRLVPNAERYLKPPAEMVRLFRDDPDAVAATHALADRIQYTMTDLGYRFPEYPVPEGETPISFLRAITLVGARERYRPFHDRARAQIARELDLIEKLGLAGYFLIVWDIVNFCREEGILVQGRGSAANSAVCYSLGITAIDPVGMDLLFERFLSEERGEWPDIDLDLPSGVRRERVIQHVYAKYGSRGAAMTANVITYRNRSAAREVGKALGMDSSHVDRLARLIGRFESADRDDGMAHDLQAAGLDAGEPSVRLFADLWHRIQDLPRHLGQHSGGMVLARGRLDDVVPLENASMPGRVVVQWDKDDCADMGIVKIDLLGLGMMSALQDALGTLNRRRPDGAPRLELWTIPPDDPAVYDMLQRADTVGVFQVESRAQMATLPRLKPATFYDLVVEVALIRPGPIVGQMVHPYLDRRAGRAEVEYPHPLLEPILKRTLGVPLFQEQLLRMAMAVAGFTGGQAEELRRAMGFKRSEQRMKQVEVQLRAGMARQGITGATADAIVRSISSFALYGFPESHAASFALLVYASAYLKTHYPAVFYAALLNNQPMGFYHPATLVKDAQRRGVRFAPIDVRQSAWLCDVEEDGAIRLGLRYASGLREQVGRAIAAAPPPVRFHSLDEFVGRTGVNRDELATLAEIGALNAFGYHRREALWQIERAVRKAGELLEEHTDGDQGPGARDQGPVLTETGHIHEGPPWEPGTSTTNPRSPVPGPCPLPPMSPTERLVADYAGTRLTIGPHPMALRRRELSLRGILRASDLPRERQGRRIRIAGTVITRQRPGTAKGFVFLTLEDETGIANIIVRPDVFARQRLVILEEPFLMVEGFLQNQEGVTSVRAERCEGIPGVPIEINAHDFY